MAFLITMLLLSTNLVFADQVVQNPDGTLTQTFDPVIPPPKNWTIDQVEQKIADGKKRLNTLKAESDGCSNSYPALIADQQKQVDQDAQNFQAYIDAAAQSQSIKAKTVQP